MQKQSERYWEPYGTFEEARTFLYCRLIDPKNYAATLEQAVRKPWNDLMRVCYMQAGSAERMKITDVTRDHLKAWNVEEETVLQAAEENTRARVTTIRNMEEVLGIDPPEEGHSPLYVMTKESGVFGAVCITESESLHRAAEVMGERFFIIPSSVHELLLLPVDDIDDSEELNRLVRHVNDTEVASHEVLTDHVYMYGPQGISW